MGTPAYMSPASRSRGGCWTIGRTFSLGVVLHEMATGRRPFEGDSSAELDHRSWGPAAARDRCERTCPPSSRASSAAASRRIHASAFRRHATSAMRSAISVE